MLSKITYFLCCMVFLYASFFFYPRWQKSGPETAIAWDVSGYYWYLPSLFIYKDIKHQSFKDSVLKKYKPTNEDFQQGYVDKETGNYVMKYSSGAAVMYLPFFAVAHWLSKPLGYPADGFSKPYQFAIQAGGLLVTLLGLWYLRRFLLQFFSDKATAICLAMLAIGTNLLNYGAIDTGMTHCWLFTIYVLILVNTHKFYARPSYRYAVFIGLLCGLATLTRPTDIISGFIPLLWGLRSFAPQALVQHGKFLLRYRKQVVVTFLCAAAVFFIQMVYWKYAVGHWIVYSYEEQGFDWAHPHFYEYMVSTHNGWLAYFPVMGLSFIGLFFLVRRKLHAIAVTTVILAALYLVVTWSYYWYGGRFMIQTYPVFIIPIACLVEWAMQRRWTAIISLPAFALLTYIGLWTNIQYHNGGLYDFNISPRAYYLAVIGRWSVPEETFKLKDTDELYRGEPEGLRALFTDNFDNDTAAICYDSTSHNKRLKIDHEHNYYDRVINTQNTKLEDWVRVTVNFHCDIKEWDHWEMTWFGIKFYRNGQEIKSNMIRAHRFLDNGVQRDLYLDARVPAGGCDMIRVYFDHRKSDKVLYIDDLRVSTFHD